MGLEEVCPSLSHRLDGEKMVAGTSLGREFNIKESKGLGLSGSHLQFQHYRGRGLAGRLECTPLIPAPGRQRQADLCEFEASVVYKT